MAPWPNQLCPHSSCSQLIRDLLAEMVPNSEQRTPAFKALISQRPGGAITCPYCQGALEYDLHGETLLCSSMEPLRYSRTKMEMRASDYGSQKTPPQTYMTPEEWIAEEKMMLSALQGYCYVEDLTP